MSEKEEIFVTHLRNTNHKEKPIAISFQFRQPTKAVVNHGQVFCERQEEEGERRGVEEDWGDGQEEPCQEE